MKTWRWWISVGSIPLWIAAVECAWAAANLAAGRAVATQIAMARADGILPETVVSENSPLPPLPDDPYVNACNLATSTPDDRELLDDFAFNWGRPHERLSLPWIRGWIRTNSAALSELRRGAGIVRDPDPTSGFDRNWDVHGVAVRVWAYPVERCARLAFCAARLARIDGEADAPARLADAVLFLRIFTDAAYGPARGRDYRPLRLIARVTGHFLEGKEGDEAAAIFVSVLRSAPVGAFRRKLVAAERLSIRARLEVYVNEPESFYDWWDLDPSGTTEIPILGDLHLVKRKISQSGIHLPLVRRELARQVAEWRAVAKSANFEGTIEGIDTLACDTWFALFSTAAALRRLPGEGHVSVQAILSRLPEELGNIVSIREEPDARVVHAAIVERYGAGVKTTEERIRVPR